MTDENTALYFADGTAFGTPQAAPALTDDPEVGRRSACVAAIERAEILASDLAHERAAHQLTVLELTAAREEAGVTLQAAQSEIARLTGEPAPGEPWPQRDRDDLDRTIAISKQADEIADLKARLLGMTACAADAARDTQAALAREGVALARLRAAGSHPALDLLVEWRKADRRDASEASTASADALEHATSNLRGAAGSLLAAREAGTALERLAETVTGRPYPEVSAELDAQVAAHPGAEPEGDETLAIDVPDIDPATSSIMDWIVEAVSIDRTRATYSPLVALSDLIAEWIEATKACEAFRGGANAGKPSPAGECALERLDTVERMLAMAGAR